MIMEPEGFQPSGSKKIKHNATKYGKINSNILIRSNSTNSTLSNFCFGKYSTIQCNRTMLCKLSVKGNKCYANI